MRSDEYGKLPAHDALCVAGYVRQLMHELHSDEKWSSSVVAVASCTDEPSWADECLDLFTINDGSNLGSVFSFKHIHKVNLFVELVFLKK